MDNILYVEVRKYYTQSSVRSITKGLSGKTLELPNTLNKLELKKTYYKK